MKKKVMKYYKKPGLSLLHANNVTEKVKKIYQDDVDVEVDSETCFYVECEDGVEDLCKEDQNRLTWILADSFKEENLACNPWISNDRNNSIGCVIEIGPRLNFSTAFSTNAVSICKSIGIKSIKRIEMSTRYLISLKKADGKFVGIEKHDRQKLVDTLHDRMTECEYVTALESFEVNVKPEICYEIDIIANGKMALEKANKDLGLSFSDWDIDLYYEVFKEKLQRNPTSVECFDLAQSNSEHSRHWFFKGRMVIDGQEMSDSLMKMVMRTQDTSNSNSLIKFSDNSR